jgi:hypothetical protein
MPYTPHSKHTANNQAGRCGSLWLSDAAPSGIHPGVGKNMKHLHSLVLLTFEKFKKIE